MSRIRLTLVGVVVLCVIAGPPVRGATEPTVCDCFAITAWTIKDGLPSRTVSAIAQDRDGYLWLGTEQGLVRFDGFQFVRVTGAGPTLPENRISALVAARSGDLWIGFEDGSGISRLRDGRLTNFTAEHGLPSAAVSALLEDRQGTIWATSLRGVFVFSVDRWHRLGHENGLPEEEVFSLYEDRSGSLWAGTADGVFRRAAGSERFALYDRGADYVQSFAEDADGTMWVTDALLAARPLGPHGASLNGSGIPGTSRSLLHDSRGNIWVAALGSGLFRIHRTGEVGVPVIERFHYEDKTSGAARYIFEDRDRNIWVGMRNGGLLRLSAAAVRHVALDGLTNDGVRALASAADGSVWVATSRSLNRFEGNQRTTYPLDHTVALYADPAGTIWAATPRGVGRFEGGRFLPLALPQSFRSGQVISLSRDERGLWLCSVRDGLFLWREPELIRFDGVESIGRKPCNFLYGDSLGRMWVGFTDGGVVVHERGSFRALTSADGLARGSIAAIVEDSHGSIWISAAGGISRVLAGKVTTATSRNGLPNGFVPSLLEDDAGRLWAGTDSGLGLIHFVPSEFDAVATNPAHSVQATAYDESDGLRWPLFWWSRPTAVRSRDGRLWLAGGGGVAIVDPDRLPPRHMAPVPRIERVVVDGKAFPPSLPQVAARALTVEIDYAVIDLTAASKLRFRYMLEGFSNTWVDAAQLRHVAYTNLQPGRYRFRVDATSNGSWSGNEAVWSFTVEPPFHRTYWFYAACGGVLSAIIWTGWWLRLRTVRAQYAVVIAERTRVSREIHDTLLQSLGGFTLQLEVVLRQLDPSQQQAREKLRHLRQHVGRCIQDARRTVWTLRCPRLEGNGLADALREMANEASAASAVPIHLDVRGKRRPSPPRVEQELLRIGQEAISNSIRHGHPSDITVTLDYRRNGVALTIADNGVGFSVEERPTTSGHWGLRIMKERAEQVNGEFRITSGMQQGTIVETYVPS